MRRALLSKKTGSALLVGPALAALAALAGCPGSLDDPSRFDDQFGIEGGACPDIPTFFATTCTATGCHAATSPAAGLDLASPDVATRLQGKMASGGTGLLLDPTNPSDSVLYTKLKGPPPFGSRMPLVGTPLGDDQLACVLTWIETSTKGAP